MFINNAEAFARWFNRKYPGAYREITAEDIEEMAQCGLICRYQYYSTSKDGETVRGVLQYEQLRQNRQNRNEIRDANGAIHCRRCGALLTKSDNKRGRPKEYCPQCAPVRGRERWRKWRHKKESVLNVH